jgi:hypothetical protein
MYYLDESEEEDPGPKYSSYVSQEDYEEEEIQGFTTREWADSEDPREDVEPWDPQAANFFHIQY